ncbi:MAG: ribonuclease P protein component [Candidatus Moranbacteria bacterium]|nr:ribonuclease P protein component [Candidatus Moranbacteria bacterium]
MLSARHRLKDKKEFNALFRGGQTFSNDVLLMKVGSGKAGEASHFGFAVGVKFSKKAVERNRVKRWMREAVRGKIKQVQFGKNIVFLVNPRFPKDGLSLTLIEEKVENLLKKAKIYPIENPIS